MRSVSRPALLFATLGACFATAGCGKGPTATAVKAERVVYASLGDCIEAGRLAAQDCDRLIQSALTVHEKSAPTYRDEATCEKAEGSGACDRNATDKFIPRPATFLVTFGATPKADAMYRGLKNAKVLRTVAGVTMTPDGQASFTDKARDKFEELFERRNRRG